MGRHLERIQDWESLARQAGHQSGLLADLAGISIRQLERHFKKCYRCTPHTWLIQTRLRHAVSLLAKGLTNKEVASLVGLGSCSALCHFFHKTTGLAPQAYLALMQKETQFDTGGLLFQPDRSRGFPASL